MGEKKNTHMFPVSTFVCSGNRGGEETKIMFHFNPVVQ